VSSQGYKEGSVIGSAALGSILDIGVAGMVAGAGQRSFASGFSF